ncbi:MAG: type II toxin-antitoxin system VapC family toxin [Acidobacteria bacterium]|nr:type II toxin-antitoxin system VapC family toxin [Acidobacteriota bacterium]
MTRYVVDASVAVKWLVREPLSHQASLLLATEVSLLAPDLLFAEAANALWAMKQRGDLEDDEFDEAVQTLRSAPVLVPSTLLQLVPAASRLAADLGHPIYDCFYLALAIQEKAPLITADRRFADRVRHHPYLAGNMTPLADFR